MAASDFQLFAQFSLARCRLSQRGACVYRQILQFIVLFLRGGVSKNILLSNWTHYWNLWNFCQACLASISEFLWLWLLGATSLSPLMGGDYPVLGDSLGPASSSACPAQPSTSTSPRENATLCRRNCTAAAANRGEKTWAGQSWQFPNNLMGGYTSLISPPLVGPDATYLPSSLPPSLPLIIPDSESISREPAAHPPAIPSSHPVLLTLILKTVSKLDLSHLQCNMLHDLIAASEEHLSQQSHHRCCFFSSSQYIFLILPILPNIDLTSGCNRIRWVSYDWPPAGKTFSRISAPARSPF